MARMTKDQMSVKNWGVLVFLYSVLISSLVQLVLLPYVFPSWHAGDGLLKQHDWVTYHKIAVSIAAQIREGGWRYWHSRPNTWIEPGLAGAVYAVTVSKPWVLIPINALIHGLSAVLLANLFKMWVGRALPLALLGAFPFAFFPTSLNWVTQIHKDGLVFFASYLYLYGWVLIIRSFRERTSGRKVLIAICSIAAGAFLIWYTRSYLGQVVTVISFLLCLGFTVKNLILYFSRRQIDRVILKQSWVSLSACWVLSIALVPVLKHGAFEDYSIPKRRQRTALATAKDLAKPMGHPESVSTPFESSKRTLELPEVPELENNLSDEGTYPNEPEAVSTPDWKYVPFLPRVLEEKVFALTIIRRGYHNTPAGRSNIDSGIEFYGVGDLVAYLPRAIEIAFFAPFYSTWFTAGSEEFNSAFKRIVVLEMLVTYFSIPFIFYFIWRRKNNLEVWFVATYAFSLLLLYTIALPNIGTLHRFRYGFLNLFVGMGLIGCVEFVRSFNWKVKPVNFVEGTV